MNARTRLLGIAAAIAALTVLTAPSTAQAACPAAPVASQDDLIIRFPVSQGIWAGSASHMVGQINNPNINVEGVVVYDSTANALKLCYGDNWIDLTDTGFSLAAAGSAGQIQFNDGSDGLAADAGRHWDNTEKRLGIGTPTPTLHTKNDQDAPTYLQIENLTSGTGSATAGLVLAGETAGLFVATGSSVASSGYSRPNAVRLFTTMGSAANGISIAARNPTGYITLHSGGNAEHMRIDAAGGISIGSAANAHTSSLLDLTSTTKGFLPPRMTAAQQVAIASPADGLMVYDTTNNVIKLRANGAWVSIADSSGGIGVTDGDKGDITVSGSGATWTIDSDAVTTAKILNANVTFAKIANGSALSVLGRSANSTGVMAAPCRWSSTAANAHRRSRHGRKTGATGQRCVTGGPLTHPSGTGFPRPMELHVHKPGPPLLDHVEVITCFSGYHPAHHREKVLPDGAIELIVDLGETPKKLFAGETTGSAVEFNRAWIAGMQRRWIIIEAQPDAAMLVIRFRPGGVYPLIALDASELTDSVFSFEDVLGRAALELRERVLEAADGPGRIAVALGWLTERLSTVPVDPVIGYLTRRLDRPAGLRIADLAEEVGYSQRHLLALFRRWVGVSPKQYARIRRFGTVLGGLAEAGDAGPDWARIAASHGYTDQSHLSHEFGAFAGMTPGAFAAAYRGLDNFLPITLEGL